MPSIPSGPAPVSSFLSTLRSLALHRKAKIRQLLQCLCVLPHSGNGGFIRALKLQANESEEASQFLTLFNPFVLNPKPCRFFRPSLLSLSTRASVVFVACLRQTLP